MQTFVTRRCNLIDVLLLFLNVAQILMVKRAEGEAESKYLSGVGVARQRQVGGTLITTGLHAGNESGALLYKL